MYDRIVLSERNLSLEKSKRKEAELYLNHILKDMERNAPILIGQKRDLNRVLESHGHLTNRLDEISRENKILRDEVKEKKSKEEKSEENISALEQHNSDLSVQLQHLLRNSMNQGNSGSVSSSRGNVALIGYGNNTGKKIDEGMKK